MFSELPKTPEQLRRRDLGVLRTLQKSWEREKTARTAFYIAETLFALGKKQVSIKWYQRAVQLTHWGEEAGWSNYRLGQIDWEKGRHDSAVKSLAMAVCCNPALAEAPWLMGVIRAQQGRAQDALAFSYQSIALGKSDGKGAEFSRVHFRDPQADWEAPWETVRAVYAALGQPERAREALAAWWRAYQARLAAGEGEPITIHPDRAEELRAIGKDI